MTLRRASWFYTNMCGGAARDALAANTAAASAAPIGASCISVLHCNNWLHRDDM